MNEERSGLRLNCRGVVQGVGFRPAVCRLAGALGLDGTLTNVSGAVRLELVGPRADLAAFVERLPLGLAPPARLHTLEVEWLTSPLPEELATARGLRILAASPQPLGEGWFTDALTPDLAPCPDCLAELTDPSSRRHGYPFVSCSRCGPRYSIATAEPWCRAHTTLAGFPLCSDCRAEFEDPADRRFHAETIACPRCGPRLRLHLADPRLRLCGTAEPLQRAATLLRDGGILALQGVGGFQLLVLAEDGAAVSRLRRRKRRPGKPLALLVADDRALSDLVICEPPERQLLRHPAAPIVLLRRDPRAAMALPAVAPGSASLGVMLPASPLHRLLIDAVGAPLVCTSGNRSGEPLCLDPAEALQRLEGIADGVLHHDRAIARRLDDSLLQLVGGRVSLLRRARGFCPEPLHLPALASTDGERRHLGRAPVTQVHPSHGLEPLPVVCGPEELTGPPPARPSEAQTATGRGSPAGSVPSPASVLALGGDLKAAPALAVGERCWLAPHLGDLADARTQERWRRGLAEALQGPQPPQQLACDSHPGYFSSQVAADMGLPLQRVPHHLAHGLAVVAEHALEPPLLLLACDGLGYGESPAGDGDDVPERHARARAGSLPRLRGGEVLRLERAADGGWCAATVASLRPFPLSGGARALREPRRVALGLLQHADLLEHPGAWRLRRAFLSEEWSLLLQTLEIDSLSPPCSSAGRLFDAAASLLGFVQVLQHEGEGGLKLQAAAARGLERCGRIGADRLLLRRLVGLRHRWLDWRPLFLGLLQRSQPGADRPAAAAWFHLSLAEGLAGCLAQLADEQGPEGSKAPVLLSGGCFQNRLLLEATQTALARRGLKALWSQQWPCNDGGLALGQLLALRWRVRLLD